MLGVGGRGVLTVLEGLKAGNQKAGLHCPNPSSKPDPRQKHSPTESTDQTSNPGRPHWGSWTGTRGALLRTQTSLRKHKLEQKSGGGIYWLYHLFLSPSLPPSSSLVSLSLFHPLPPFPAWTLILRMLPPAADKEGSQQPLTSLVLSSSHL